MKNLVFLLSLMILSCQSYAQVAVPKTLAPTDWNITEYAVEDIMLGQHGWQKDTTMLAGQEGTRKVILFSAEREGVLRAFGFEKGRLTASYLRFYAPDEASRCDAMAYADQFTKREGNYWIDLKTHTHIRRIFDGAWVEYEMTNENWAEGMLKNLK
ncbi:hypothetical protein [Hymenobacter metallicola]|uniref:Uncharacterized protein n=1 Tax=Hymenobacter metallicola TaxID=2563114 RepID=A0A4Z0QKL5_9BACT|nr:hypothetical protein [Hymenobacter metallicola]TGE29799.1 hypothetical protein E5K02_10170 [Hymenobacter metallicola]